MAQTLSSQALMAQNQDFAGTGGISQENCCLGFVPGFMDKDTGRVFRSCMADGCPAPIHLLDGLPDDVVLNRDPRGHVATVKSSVIAGFIRNGLFYTRDEVILALK